MCANVVRKAPQKSYTTLSKETNPGERGLPPQLPRPFPIVKKKPFISPFLWSGSQAVAHGDGGRRYPGPPPAKGAAERAAGLIPHRRRRRRAGLILSTNSEISRQNVYHFFNSIG